MPGLHTAVVCSKSVDAMLKCFETTDHEWAVYVLLGQHAATAAGTAMNKAGLLSSGIALTN